MTTEDSSDLAFIPRNEFAQIVRLTPLVSLDLIIRNPSGAILVGMRNREPAKDFFFVPGGRIQKNERIDNAFTQILKAETGLERRFSDAEFVGVFEHFYPTNAAEMPGFGTHYVVLAHQLRLRSPVAITADDQHCELTWLDPITLASRGDVHPYTKAYVANDV